MSITHRYFNLLKENPEPLFQLFEKTWGTNALHDRWEWEYKSNPNAKKIKVLVSEDNEKVVAATTRMPFELITKRKTFQGYFSINSMADPEYRGQGVMSGLYKKAAIDMPLLYSKGSAPGMYRLLMKLGYQAIEPNTYQVKILAPVKWFLWRYNLKSIKQENSIRNYMPTMGFVQIERFGDDFDRFWKEIHIQFEGIITRNAEYMNWRYLDIPYHKYIALYKMNNGEIASVVVLKESGTSCRIVDLLWNGRMSEEPAKTLQSICKLSKKAGFLKLLCWSTQKKIRHVLKENGFVDRKEKILVSALCSINDASICLNGNKIYLMEGDGDSEYI